MGKFEDIILLPVEEKLLFEMVDDKWRDVSTPNIQGLRGYELVDMIQEFPEPNNPRPYKMQYKINQFGKRYILYLQNLRSSTTYVKKNDKKIIKLSKIGIAISLIAALAAIASTILSAVSIALSKH